jgi:predicted DNA-binding transcriptional regulator AlpA
MQQHGQKLRKQQIADRYQHSVRTIERWWKDPAVGFPQPIFIGKSPLWDLDKIEAWERTRPSVSHAVSPTKKQSAAPAKMRPKLTITDLDDLELVPREAAE